MTSCMIKCPSDWPDYVPELSIIDNLMRCAICFEYMKVSMILPQCSHNYCSLCIRKYLSYKSQCPTCLMAVSEPEMKNNRLLDDLIENFILVRSRLLQAVKSLNFKKSYSPKKIHNYNNSPSKNNHKSKNFSCEELPSPSFIENGLISMESPSSAVGSCVSSNASSPLRESCSEETLNSQPKSILTPPKSKLKGIFSSVRCSNRLSRGDANKQVACPVCKVDIPNKHINIHLDFCLTRSEKCDTIRRTRAKRKPMAKLVYHLLSNKDLRQKVKDVGLNTMGDRMTLIKRHHDFCILYNAECDSLSPRPVSSLIKEIERLEKEKNRVLPYVTDFKFDKNTDEVVIDKIKKNYIKKHASHFQELIDKAKTKMVFRATQVRKKLDLEENAKESEEKTCPNHLETKPDSDVIKCEKVEIENNFNPVAKEHFLILQLVPPNTINYPHEKPNERLQSECTNSQMHDFTKETSEIETNSAGEQTMEETKSTETKEIAETTEIKNNGADEETMEEIKSTEAKEIADLPVLSVLTDLQPDSSLLLPSPIETTREGEPVVDDFDYVGDSTSELSDQEISVLDDVNQSIKSFDKGDIDLFSCDSPVINQLGTFESHFYELSANEEAAYMSEIISDDSSLHDTEISKEPKNTVDTVVDSQEETNTENSEKNKIVTNGEAEVEKSSSILKLSNVLEISRPNTRKRTAILEEIQAKKVKEKRKEFTYELRRTQRRK